MTDPTVTIELTFDSTDLFGETGDGCRMAFWIRDGFNNIPTTRGEDQVVPGRTGRVARARVADELRLTLEGWLTVFEGVSQVAAQSAFRQAMTTLQDLFATLDVVVLSAALEDGSTATLNVRVEPPVLIREAPRGLTAQFDVDLRSIDPYWVIAPAGS